MDERSEDRRSLNLKRSDHSIDSTPTVLSPGSPKHHRPGYHRITSLNEVDTSYRRAEGDSSDRDAQLESSSSFGITGKGFGSSQGRGLRNVETRRPVAVGSNDIPSTPFLGDPLLPPSSTGIGGNSPHVERDFENEGTHYGEQGRNGSNSAVFEPFTASSDHERLHRNTLSATETHVEPFESGYRAGQRRKHGQMNWLSTTILVLAVYSTVGSGLWLAVALIRPRWGRTDFSNRIINNISMAMPHAGVFAAAQDPLNNIIQPQDLSGLGEYVLRASVPSPVVNILCASAAKDELDPLVKTSWPNATLDVTRWPEYHGLPNSTTWLDQNETALDKVFKWGGKYGRQRPMFAKYPIPYNTIVNASNLGYDSIYLLATTAAGQPTLCSIRASLTPSCSTEYHAKLGGGTLTAHCEDPTDGLSYHKSDPKATDGVLNKDWITVAITWIYSISLNTGITDDSPSNSRLLAQLILGEPALNPSLPSIAEYLAVLSGRTLLMSTLDAPFIHFWNYSATVPVLKDPQYQAFNATLNFQDYASGGTQRWQNLFHVVLIVIFVTNVVCLAYLILNRGLVTDFIEPENLFSLSLNSPPSKNLSGSPKKEQLATNWIIKQGEQDQLYIHAGETQPVRRKKQGPLDYEMQSPTRKLYSRFASTRTSVF